jgi:hypothetical protein
VVPGFVGDDLIFASRRIFVADTLSIPAENSLSDCSTRGADELVMTWPTESSS